jgi:hypothetical protein
VSICGPRKPLTPNGRIIYQHTAGFECLASGEIQNINIFTQNLKIFASDTAQSLEPFFLLLSTAPVILLKKKTHCSRNWLYFFLLADGIKINTYPVGPQEALPRRPTNLLSYSVHLKSKQSQLPKHSTFYSTNLDDVVII